MMQKTLVLLSCYLLGSIPFSFLITRLVTGKDIRNIGSGNVGATNVLRTSGKVPGLIALMLDLFKGIAAIWIGEKAGIAPIAAFAAMLGHSYPIFLKFRGGKSVATGGGAFLMLAPLAIASSIILFIVMTFSFRIVSLSSIFASASFPVFAWLYDASPDVIIWGAVCAALIVLRHKPNIQRLMRGEERKIGKR